MKNKNLRYFKAFFYLIFFSILFYFSTNRYFSYQSQAFDLGIFNQAVWLLAQGKSAFVTLIDRQILADHLAFNFYLIGLIYKIWPSPVFLLFLQATVYTLALLVVSRLGKLYQLDRVKRLLLIASFAIHPVIFNSNLFDFHLESFALLFLLLVLLCIKKSRFFLAYTFLVLALGCKESVSLAVACLGLYLLLSKENQKHGSIILIVGLAYFVLAYSYFLPNLNEGRSVAGMDRFPSLGSSPKEIIFSIIKNPFQLLGLIAWKSGIKYLLKFFLPFIYAVSLRSWPAILSLCPLLLMNLSSASDLQRSLNFQYSVIPLIFLLLIALDSLKTRRFADKHIKFLASFLFILFLAQGFRILGDRECEYPHRWCRDPDMIDVYSDLISKVPENCKLIAPSHLVPQLSMRDKVLMLEESALEKIPEYNCLITSDSDPGWLASKELNRKIISRVKKRGSKTLYTNNGNHLLVW